MEEAPARLDALSEMMALSSYGNTKNILITAVETKGHLDEEALTLAIRQAAKDFPRLASCVKEVRERGRYRLVWDQSLDMELPVKISELQPANGSSTWTLSGVFSGAPGPSIVEPAGSTRCRS